jgi:cholesterol transport system auxiliary component
MAGRMWKCGVVMIVTAIMAGCLSPRTPEGPIHTYVLARNESAVERSRAATKRDVQSTLLVNVPRAEPGFDTPRMAYLARPFELSYYATHQWAETPARMLVTLLVQSLEQSGAWRAVVPVPTSVKGDYRVDGQGLVLQQEFVQRPSQVRLALRLQLVALGEQRVVGTKWFELVEPAASEDAYGGVSAANRAVTRLLEQATVWLVSCLGEGLPHRC